MATTYISLHSVTKIKCKKFPDKLVGGTFRHKYIFETKDGSKLEITAFANSEEALCLEEKSD